MYKSHNIITRRLKPYIALGGTSTPWSHPPPQLLDSMPMTLSFPPKSKPPTKNDYLSDLKIFKRMCHRLWRKLKKKDSGNVWGNISGSIKGLPLSQGHSFEERKIRLYCKSNFFLNSAAATKVIPFLTVIGIQYEVNTPHGEGLRSGCDTSIVNDTTSLQGRVIWHKAHTVVANYCRSLHQPRGIGLGILLRKWETC